MPATPRSQHAFLTTLGWVYVAAGAVLNLWLVVAPADVAAGESRRALGVISVLLLGLGLVTIQTRSRELAVNFNLAVLSVLVVVPLAGEAVLRAGIALGVSRLRQPILYADAADDTFWQLYYRWEGRAQVVPWKYAIGARHDPWLGWISDDPDTGASGSEVVPSAPVLMYGDSMVSGIGSTALTLSEQLSRELSGAPVYNFGVRGYGLDQTFLRFQRTYGQFARPVIVFGVLMENIDRSLTRLRFGPKPIFALDGGRLRLHGVPVPENRVAWITTHPPRIRSYFLAWAGQTWRWAAAGGNRYESSYRRDFKQQLTRALIGELASTVRSNNMPLLVVLFYAPGELQYTGWREKFLKTELDRLGIPYLDTKLALREAMRRDAAPVTVYYQADSHLSERGNAVAASAIADYLRQLQPYAYLKIDTQVQAPGLYAQ